MENISFEEYTIESGETLFQLKTENKYVSYSQDQENYLWDLPVLLSNENQLKGQTAELTAELTLRTQHYSGQLLTSFRTLDLDPLSTTHSALSHVVSSSSGTPPSPEKWSAQSQRPGVSL